MSAWFGLLFWYHPWCKEDNLILIWLAFNIQCIIINSLHIIYNYTWFPPNSSIWMKIRYLPQPNIKAKYNNYAARVITQILKVNLFLLSMCICNYLLLLLIFSRTHGYSSLCVWLSCLYWKIPLFVYIVSVYEFSPVRSWLGATKSDQNIRESSFLSYMQNLRSEIHKTLLNMRCLCRSIRPPLYFHRKVHR